MRALAQAGALLCGRVAAGVFAFGGTATFAAALAILKVSAFLTLHACVNRKWDGDQHTGEEVEGRHYYFRVPPPAKPSTFPEPENVPIFNGKLPTLQPLPAQPQP